MPNFLEGVMPFIASSFTPTLNYILAHIYDWFKNGEIKHIFEYMIYVHYTIAQGFKLFTDVGKTIMQRFQCPMGAVGD